MKLSTIRTLRGRIVVFFVLLMLVVQVGVLGLTSSIGESIARRWIAEELTIGERVFERLLAQNTAQLLQGARILAADFAFREAIATRDTETIASALRNHGARMGAHVTLLIDRERTMTADRGEPPADAAPIAELIDVAMRERSAAALARLDGRLHQLVVVPVMAPLPIGWVALGFAVDDRVAQDLQRLTGLQVSFVGRRDAGDWSVDASTLDSSRRHALLELVADADPARQALLRQGRADIDGHLALRASAGSVVGGEVVALLQKSVRESMLPFEQLRDRLLLISSLGLALSLAGSVLLASGIARPVGELAAIARRIAAGQYRAAPAVERGDEIGDLARAFEHMRSEIASREQRILDLAYRDPLTGLPNRALFVDRLRAALAERERIGTPLSVLALDLDRFRDVNDSLGHHWGDLLLQEVAARLAQLAGADATVARMGGDEFAILLPGRDAAGAVEIAAAVHAALEPPANLQGHLVDSRASVGIATCPAHGTDTIALLRSADAAMQRAKRDCSGHAVHDAGHDQQAGARLTLLSELRRAVEGDQLTLYYQPKLHRDDPQRRSVEALLRWTHPQRGFVPPDQFIPFAEQTGYIRAVTGWVLEHAIAQAADWLHRGKPVHVAINVSARDLLGTDLPDRCEAALRQHRIAADWLRLEITESAVIDEPAQALANLKRLRELGLRLSLDDFGTGYTSLAHLRRLPVDELKIDKSFVMTMDRDEGNDAIVRSTIELGHNLGLQIVAEGVETAAIAARLTELGCDYLQGYLYSRPLPADAVERWFDERFVRSRREDAVALPG